MILESNNMEDGYFEANVVDQSNINMEGLTLYNSLPLSDGENDASFQKLEKHMRQLSETMLRCKHCGAMRSEDEVSKIRGSPSQRYFGSTCEENIYQKQREMDELRRDNNRMVLEAAYLRKENSVYVKRLKEGHIIQERLKNQLEQLRKKLDSRPSLFETGSFDFDTINNNVIREQLKAYREDFYEEKREREKYHARNMELERQLEEAKKTLEMQQKKLLLYSQIFSQPFRTKLDLSPILSSEKSKLKHDSYSTPPSPHCTSPRPHKNVADTKEHKRTSVSIDLPSNHKTNDHILEATLLSGGKPRIKRSTTPPAYFRDYSAEGYLSDRIYEYDWSLRSEDVISK